MNYLAHIYLADKDEKNILGNFLGDFVNKSLEDNYEVSIKNGIFMHRKLDSFTDSNAIFMESRNRISRENRRFGGVLIDVFYDHFLAKNWSTYSDLPLEVFADNFYGLLKRYTYCLPEKLLERMPYMIEENWLFSYKNIENIKIVLDRISMRFSRSNHLLISPVEELTRNYEALENDFKRFFPYAIEYANALKRKC